MKLVYADQEGNVFDHEDWDAVGRSGELITEILEEELIPLPSGATLVSLPDSKAIGIDPESGEMQALPGDYTAVGALLPQGFTRLLLPGYVKTDKTKKYPLFGYTAVVWKEGQFYAAAHATEDPERWDPKQRDFDELELQVKRLTEAYPENRLYQHLSHCALSYECLTAANTFYQRWEGAVPVSYSCNAGCYGCISEQPDDSGFPSPQTRMNFRPTADEITEIMLEHLQDPDRIISFGQGCEGEPSTQAAVIIEAMKRVRSITKNGFININTNAGLTDHIRGIVDAGLDLMRVSTISARDDHYNAYYKPRGYSLENVKKSTRYATDQGVYTSINYLVFPGVTDREEEIEAMIDFIRQTGLRKIQMRNLNIDPESYLGIIPKGKSEPIGMKRMMEIYREEIPDLVIGSFSSIAK